MRAVREDRRNPSVRSKWRAHLLQMRNEGQSRNRGANEENYGGCEMIARRCSLRRSWLRRKSRRYVVPPEILAYWEWIRKQPCAVCGLRRLIEVAHVGVRGLAQKCNGWEVIPLCRFHHARGFPESHHELGKRFWSYFGLDRCGLIAAYKARYFSLIGISPSRVPESVRPGGVL